MDFPFDHSLMLACSNLYSKHELMALSLFVHQDKTERLEAEFHFSAVAGVLSAVSNCDFIKTRNNPPAPGPDCSAALLSALLGFSCLYPCELAGHKKSRLLPVL